MAQSPAARNALRAAGRGQLFSYKSDSHHPPLLIGGWFIQTKSPNAVPDVQSLTYRFLANVSQDAVHFSTLRQSSGKQ
jgi:hypothetical protein